MARILVETVNGTNAVAIEDKFLQDREIFLVEQVDATSTNELMKQHHFKSV